MEASDLRRLHIRRLHFEEKNLRGSLAAKEKAIRAKAKQVGEAREFINLFSGASDPAGGARSARSRAALKNRTEVALKDFEAELRAVRNDAVLSREKLVRNISRRDSLLEADAAARARSKCVESSRQQESHSEMLAAAKLGAEANPLAVAPPPMRESVSAWTLPSTPDAEAARLPREESEDRATVPEAGSMGLVLEGQERRAEVAWSGRALGGYDLNVTLPGSVSRFVGRTVESEVRRALRTERRPVSFRVDWERRI